LLFCCDSISHKYDIHKSSCTFRTHSFRLFIYRVIFSCTHMYTDSHTYTTNTPHTPHTTHQTITSYNTIHPLTLTLPTPLPLPSPLRTSLHRVPYIISPKSLHFRDLDGWQHETQILTWVLSYDKIHSPESLSICSASAAMCISEVSYSYSDSDGSDVRE
jgi:hypothetical protein